MANLTTQIRNVVVFGHEVDVEVGLKHYQNIPAISRSVSAGAPDAFRASSI